MSYRIVSAMSDLYGNVSFGGGGSSSGGSSGSSGGGGLLSRVQGALTAGRARAVARGGGYSDGGNWRTALDTNSNGRVLDDVTMAVGVVASVAPAGRVVNTIGRVATGVAVIDHYR